MAIINARGLQPLSLTTAQRGALSGDQRPTGLMVFDNELGDVMLWNGTTWLTIGSVQGTVVYKGTIDATTTPPPLSEYENGDLYINTTAGTVTTGWTGIEGVGIGTNDRIIFDGSNWSIYSVTTTPNLQAVTNAGSTTTNSISAGGFTTAGTTATNNLTVTDTASVGSDITLSGTTGKITSAATVTGDSDTTLTTKKYVQDLIDSTSSVTISSNAPSSPSNEDLWWDSDSGRLYIYYTNAWVDAAPADGFTEPVTFSQVTTHEAGVSVTGASSFEVTGTAASTTGITQTFTDIPYGTIQYFKPTGATRTEQMSSYVRITHDDEGDKDLDTGRLSCFYGQFRNSTPFRFTRDADVACYDNRIYEDGIKAAAGSTVTVSGFRSNVSTSTEEGVTNYNFLAVGSARNYFRGTLHVAGDINALPNYNGSGGVGVKIGADGEFFSTLSRSSESNANLYIVRAGNDNAQLIRFVYTASLGTSGTQAGKIELDGANAVKYTTTSDYRLKENITSLPNAIDRVKQLNPYQYNFIGDTARIFDGFLAHEVAEVSPRAVSGTKDEEEAIGTLTDAAGVVTTDVTEPEAMPYGETWVQTGTRPVYQSVDQTKLIPLLTKALQETIAKNEELEARIATLEGGNN